MKLRSLFFISGFIIFLSWGSFAQKAGDDKSSEIIILHVNDMHAKIDNLPKLAYLADSLRRTHPYVFLVASGDNFTGNPIVDMYSDKGFPMIDLMNSCGFDVSAIGNHEFDLGQETMNKRFQQAKFPFICCNLDAAGAVLKQPRPFAILEAGDVARIAFLGILELNDQGIPDSHPSNLTGIRFVNGIGKAIEYTGLKEKYGILIGLSHLGVEDDAKLANEMPQLDLILGGHSHTLIDKPMIVNGVMILQAGSNLKEVGKTTLTVLDGHVTSARDEIIRIRDLSGSNSTVQALVNEYNDNKEFKRVVAKATADISGYDELGSLMTDALTSQFNTDMAFLNNGGIRIDSLSAGDIMLKDVYRLDPFNNKIVIYRMNAKEISSLIINAFNIKKQIDLQVSGMTYSVVTDDGNRCTEVKMKDLTGKPLDPTREYKVAMNSYMAASYTFDHRDAGSSATIPSATALIDFLEKEKKVNYHGVKRAFRESSGPK